MSNAPQASGFGTVFTNLKVSTKIVAGFAVVLAIVLVSSAVSYMSLARIAADFDGYTEKSAFAAAVATVDEAFTDFERNAQIFAATGGKREADAALAAAAGTRSALDGAAKLTDDPAEKKELKAASEAAQSYAKNFDKLVAARTAQDTLTRTVLDVAGPAAAEGFQQLAGLAARGGNSNAEVLALTGLQSLMTVRINANKLLARHEAAAASAAEQAAHDLEATLAGLDAAVRVADQRKALGDVGALVTKYLQAYEKGAELSHEIETLAQVELLEVGHELMADLNTIKAAIDADEKQLEEGLHGTTETAELAAMVIGLAGLVLGGFLALLIGRTISRPVIGMPNRLHQHR